METPTLVDALRAKYDALEADFGSKAADRLREVVEHALAQITGATPARRGRPPKSAASSVTRATKKGRRSWSPAQKEEQRKKMQAYWAAKRKPKTRKAKGKKAAHPEAPSAE